MLEERLQELSAKQSLDGDDAFALLQLLQEQTTPILSLRSAGSSTAASSDRRPSAKPRDGATAEGRRDGGRLEFGGGGKSSRRGTSPKRALFSSQPGSGGAPALNVDSLVEFPPMQPPAAIINRKKDKKATKPPRRITLTSLQHHTPHQSPSSHLPHFTSPPPASDSWSSHPAFVGQVATTSDPSPLSEERQLLMRERSRQLQRKSGSGKVSGSTGVTPCSRSTTVCQSSLIRQTFPSGAEDSGHQHHPLPYTDALTSTPAPDGLAAAVISIDRVSNKTTLDQLAHLHSNIITNRLVPNITSEIHFAVQLLTCTQPASLPQNASSGGSEHPFSTVENCVYFAVRVLYRIRSLLTALDTATLQLLSENSRIKQFEPKLAIFLSGALEAAQTEVGSGGQRQRLLSPSAFPNRVPFQEETDNLKNFPTMKVFHAFKKQRDNFYCILREWEANHNVAQWNFQSALRERIRALVSQPPELCSLDHLATLFQKQLMESCGYAALMSGGVGGLVEGPLKNLNPDKLMKLTERFLRQSHVGTGTCPPPAFSESEQFFSTFISTADSYTFNCHLTAALHHALLKLHSRCETLAAREVPVVLHAMKVLAKFLGYLDFLPHSGNVSPSLPQARTPSPHVTMVSKCVGEAVEKCHLSLTIPWAVDYLSMMDSRALQVLQYYSLLYQMITIYRSCLIEGEGVTADAFLVLTCLGWLLETPNVPSSVFFQIVKTGEPQLSRLLQSEQVTRDLVYVVCPYLASIRVILAEFASGLQPRTSPIRKIKPVPAGPSTSQPQPSPASQLQMKLQENFFRNHPPVLKQLCDTVSERVSETAIQLVQSEVVPEHVRNGVQTLAVWISQSCSDRPGTGSGVNLEELFHRSEAVRKVGQVSEQTFSRVLRETTLFSREHCRANTCKAISALVCGTIPNQVAGIAIGISTDWAMERCMKWVHSKLRGIVFGEVSAGFEKLRKAVRAGIKATQAHHSTPDHLPSQNTSPSPIASNISLQSYNDSVSSLDQTLPHLLSLSSGNYIEASAHPSTFQVSTPGAPTSTPSPASLLRESETSQTASGAMSLFMELATSALAEKHKSPPKDAVLEVAAAVGRLREHILSEVEVVEGGHSPHLLPRGTDNLLSTSVQLATLLVARGLMESSVYSQLTSLWSLLKGLKQEIPIHLLLSADSFAHYLQQAEKGNEGVWSSLTCLLLEVIELSISAPDIIEALWMCRIRQSSTSERQSIISASAVFLAEWFSQDQKPQERGGGTGVLREACFVRLLGAVVSESDSPLIGTVRNHSSLNLLSL